MLALLLVNIIPHGGSLETGNYSSRLQLKNRYLLVKNRLCHYVMNIFVCTVGSISCPRSNYWEGGIARFYILQGGSDCKVLYITGREQQQGSVYYKEEVTARLYVYRCSET